MQNPKIWRFSMLVKVPSSEFLRFFINFWKNGIRIEVASWTNLKILTFSTLFSIYRQMKRKIENPKIQRFSLDSKGLPKIFLGFFVKNWKFRIRVEVASWLFSKKFTKNCKIAVFWRKKRKNRQTSKIMDFHIINYTEKNFWKFSFNLSCPKLLFNLWRKIR